MLTDEFTHIVVIVADDCIQINVYFLPSGFTTASPEKTGISGEAAPPAVAPLHCTDAALPPAGPPTSELAHISALYVDEGSGSTREAS